MAFDAGNTGTLLVCAKGSVSAQGVAVVVYPNRGFVRQSIPFDPASALGSRSHVKSALMDSQDSHVDFVSGQCWYKSDGAPNPSFAPHKYCTGPDGTFQFDYRSIAYPVE